MEDDMGMDIVQGLGRESRKTYIKPAPETRQQRKDRQQIIRLRILDDANHLSLEERIAYFEDRIAFYATFSYNPVGLRPSIYMILKLKGEKIFKKYCE